MDQFEIHQINRLILKKHHLSNNSKIDDILKISEDLCGLHGTGTIEPYLSLFVRMNNFKKEDLDTELYVKKTLGKIRGMRKTLFIETKELIPIVHNVIKYQTVKRDNKYLEIREISKSEYRELSDKILYLLNEKEMSTTELKKALNSQKDIVAVISVMCDEMLLIRGKPLKSWRDRRLYYSPFNKYFPEINLNEFTESKSTELLIERYIKSYGPVTENDIIWWLGITKGKARSAIDKLHSKLELIKIDQFEHEYIIHKQDIKTLSNMKDSNESSINVLPNLDPYIMGYKDRERYVDYNYYKYIFDRSGNGTTTILLDGHVNGIWDITEKPEPQIKLYMLKEFDSNLSEIKRELKKLGKFIIGKDISIQICDNMIPLTERTMGSFMSPLKECS
jgi:hypothetical protein